MSINKLFLLIDIIKWFSLFLKKLFFISGILRYFWFWLLSRSLAFLSLILLLFIWIIMYSYIERLLFICLLVGGGGVGVWFYDFYWSDIVILIFVKLWTFFFINWCWYNIIFIFDIEYIFRYLFKRLFGGIKNILIKFLDDAYILNFIFKFILFNNI